MKSIQSRGLSFAVLILLASALAGCGGGGGGGESSTTPPVNGGSGSAPGGGGNNGGTPNTTIPSGTTQPNPTYQGDSVTAAMFAAINSYRTTCGFPQLAQNTVLDTSADNHAKYQVLNGNTITDLEVQGKEGFTGVTGQDRAVAQGWPAGVWVGAVDAGSIWSPSSNFTSAQIGRQIINALTATVYHQRSIMDAVALVGVGAQQTMINGTPIHIGSVQLANDKATPTEVTSVGNVLTFPCDGVTGVSYGGISEQPMPPNVSANGWGTPLTIKGNTADTVIVNVATMQPTGGAPISLNIINSQNDTTGLIAKYEAVAYAASPLLPSTRYEVYVAGTISGKPFSRSFPFWTGSTLQ